MSAVADTTASCEVVTCSIETLSIPRFIAAYAFVSYWGEGFQGTTPIFRANEPVKEIDRRFVLPVFRGVPVVHFSVNAKAPNGACHKFGEDRSRVPCPEEIAHVGVLHNTVHIKSDVGEFCISIAFETVNHASDILLGEAAAFVSRPSSEHDHFVRLIKSIPSRMTVDMGKTRFYGEDGIPTLLTTLVASCDNEVKLKELRGVIPDLAKKVEEATYLGSVARGIAVMTINGECVSLRTGEIIPFGELRMSNEPKIPRVAAYLMGRIDDAIEQNIDTTGLEDVLLDWMGHERYADDSVILMQLSAMFFVKEFMRVRHPQVMMSAQCMLSSVFIQTESWYITHVISGMPDNCSASAVAAELSRIEQWFRALSLPDTMWKGLKKYLCSHVDIVMCRKVIYTNVVAAKVASDFKKKIGDYEWPVLTKAAKDEAAILEILAKSGRTNKLEKLAVHLPKVWLCEIVARRGGPEAIIDSWRSEPACNIPEPDDIDDWTHEQSTHCKWTPPEKIPKCDI